MNRNDKRHIFSGDETRIITNVQKMMGPLHPQYYIETFGCQMNVHDSEKLAGMLEKMGYSQTEAIQSADLILMNTCCVREHAESKVFGHLGALLAYKQEKPDLVIAVCGCMMQQKDVALRVKNRFPFVDVIFGTHNLHRFPMMLQRVLGHRIRVFEVYEADGGIVEGVPVRRSESVQAFVTIMYGCNNFCSYCIVPHVRGRERSRSVEDIVRESQELAHSGVKEITVLGQNVNSYGKDFEEPSDFAKLLLDLAKIDGLERIRFMTSHPKDVSAELIRAMADCPKICKHIHLPMQSGSTKILKAMNRRYSREDFLELVGRMKDTVQELEITTDIIVGFPGETREDFADTLDLVRRVGFSAAYTFMYSPRTGTAAATMADQVPQSIKKERLLTLNALVAEMITEQNETFIGRVERVLTEGVRTTDGGGGLAYGRTHASKMIYFQGEAIPGSPVDVKITHAREVSLYGQQIEA